MFFIKYDGGGGDDLKEPVTVTIYSEAIYDGYISSFGVVDNSSAIAKVGDNSSNQGLRAFVSFNIDSIPANAIILDAVLYIYQNTVTGTPYSLSSGGISLDHIYYNTNFLASEYNSVAIDSYLGPLTILSTTGYKTFFLNLSSYVQNDKANSRHRTQFRLYFQTETDYDLTEDSTSWTMGDSSTNKPYMEITYQ